MKLRPRLFGVALLVAIPAAVLVFMTAGWLHARDMREAMDRFITSQLTDDTRERCDTNPNWFLAGPRPDRPTAQQLSAPDADVTAPRPSTQELPFDFFAYDSAYQPLSTAGPRFPSDMRQTLRRPVAQRLVETARSEADRRCEGGTIPCIAGNHLADAVRGDRPHAEKIARPAQQVHRG
jgi:hypothetical protein